MSGSIRSALAAVTGLSLLQLLTDMSGNGPDAFAQIMTWPGTVLNWWISPDIPAIPQTSASKTQQAAVSSYVQSGTSASSSSSSGTSGGGYSGGKVSGTVASEQSFATSYGQKAYGWGAAQMSALKSLWNRESGWSATAQNPTSTAYGIAQFLDTTWAGEGVTKTSDPETQIEAGEKYIDQRYGNPGNAWSHEEEYGWY
jgi:hypothetical protein